MEPMRESMETYPRTAAEAGDEVARSTVESLSGEDQVVAGGGVDGHQLAADASLAEAPGRAGSQGVTGPRAREPEPPAGGEGEGGRGSEPVSGQVLRSERAALSREAARGTSDRVEL